MIFIFNLRKYSAVTTTSHNTQYTFDWLGTYLHKLSLSQEAKSCSATQEVLSILWNLK
jgi:hypothetical protein